jgi:hypothetical protein
VHSFLDKNRETLSNLFVRAIKGSACAHYAGLVADVDDTGTASEWMAGWGAGSKFIQPLISNTVTHANISRVAYHRYNAACLVAKKNLEELCFLNPQSTHLFSNHHCGAPIFPPSRAQAQDAGHAVPGAARSINAASRVRASGPEMASGSSLKNNSYIWILVPTDIFLTKCHEQMWVHVPSQHVEYLTTFFFSFDPAPHLPHPIQRVLAALCALHQTQLARAGTGLFGPRQHPAAAAVRRPSRAGPT